MNFLRKITKYGLHPIVRECPKCGQVVLPSFHKNNVDAGVTAPGTTCGYIQPMNRNEYCTLKTPFGEHLNWPCNCGYSWITPTLDKDKTT